MEQYTFNIIGFIASPFLLAIFLFGLLLCYKVLIKFPIFGERKIVKMVDYIARTPEERMEREMGIKQPQDTPKKPEPKVPSSWLEDPSPEEEIRMRNEMPDRQIPRVVQMPRTKFEEVRREDIDPSVLDE